MKAELSRQFPGMEFQVLGVKPKEEEVQVKAHHRNNPKPASMAEMFKQMTGSDLTFVAYKSNPAALTDLLGGQIDLMFADTATAQAQIQGGKLRALAYTGAKRTSAFASLPTIDEAGVKGYESSYWIAVYAPRGTPPDIVRQLNAAFIKGVHTDAVKLQFARAVLDIYTTSPAELAEFQQAEIEKWGRVIKGAGIQPE
jgi:tripartite-type tricarboxylate transporter receptor subunit TctC